MPTTAVWQLRAEARLRAAVSVGVLAAGLVLGAAVFAFVASFAWPTQAMSTPRNSVFVGKLSDYRVNQPVFQPEGSYWLVRQPDDMILALSGKDSGRGCTLPWRETFSFTDPGTGEVRKGWFRSPCGGDTYDLDGACVFGPCSRNLDTYRVEIRGRSIVVHTGILLKSLNRGRPAFRQGQ
jgi:nitrite reductase/ring-hydroxylating ferredoxin subunit